jgi:hypothetical protein
MLEELATAATATTFAAGTQQRQPCWLYMLDPWMRKSVERMDMPFDSK